MKTEFGDFMDRKDLQFDYAYACRGRRQGREYKTEKETGSFDSISVRPPLLV